MTPDQQTSEKAGGAGVRGERDDLRMGPGGGVFQWRTQLPERICLKRPPCDRGRTPTSTLAITSADQSHPGVSHAVQKYCYY